MGSLRSLRKEKNTFPYLIWSCSCCHEVFRLRWRDKNNRKCPKCHNKYSLGILTYGDPCPKCGLKTRKEAIFDFDEVHLYWSCEECHDLVREIEWPEEWPEYVSKKFLEIKGFRTIDV
jgi:hypothetical protein